MKLRRRHLKWIGPAGIVVLCAFPVLLWLIAPLPQRFGDLATTLRGVAVPLGLAGVTAFAINLSLGGRVRLVEPLFGGLDRMYRIHHTTGVTSFWLLLSHGVLMLVGAGLVSAEFMWDLVLPSGGWTVTAGVIALLAFTVTMAMTLYAHVNHEVFLWIHRAFGLVFLVGAFHVFTTPGTKAVSPLLTFYLGLLSVLGFGAYLYRSVFGETLVRRRFYRVTDIRRWGTDVAEITMSPTNGRLVYRPGQFVFLTFVSRSLAQEFHPFSVQHAGQSEVVSFAPGAIRKQFHPFSITSSPHERDLRVSIKASGDYTAALRHLRVGDGARIEGPFGSFSHLEFDSARQIWIAGGIGVTPFLSMARSLTKRGDFDIDLYYCTKTRREAYFIPELEELAHQPGLRVIAYPEDEMGFITADVMARESQGLEGAEILMCGPQPMMAAVERQLIARGIKRDRIHYEEFGFVK